jgi:putative DNA primase/helicase
MSDTAASAKRIWDGSTSIVGTGAETFLQSRGITPLSPPPLCLRFAAKLKHPCEQYFPALVVQATHPETGAPIGGVQRIFLAWKGDGKAQVSPKEQKMSLGPCKGSVARLAEPIDGQPLLIGEGVETVLTTMEAASLPGWATLGTSGLKAFQPPDTIKHVILLAENDAGPNKKALDALIPMLTARGIKIGVARPPIGLKDFNDCVNGKSGHTPAAGLALVKAAIEAAQTD